LVSLQLVDDDVSGVSLQEVWSIPLAGKLTSNIAAVSYNNGGEMHRRIALAAASGRKMRVWISPSPEDAHENISTTTISTATSMDSTSTSAEGPYALNDGFKLNFSNAEPEDCSAQSKLVAESGLSIATLFLILFLTIN